MMRLILCRSFDMRGEYKAVQYTINVPTERRGELTVSGTHGARGSQDRSSPSAPCWHLNSASDIWSLAAWYHDIMNVGHGGEDQVYRGVRVETTKCRVVEMLWPQPGQ